VFDVHVILKLEQENKLELVSFQKKEKIPLDLEVERLLVQIIEEKNRYSRASIRRALCGARLRIQRKIKKFVSRIKKSEIPSTPRRSEKLKDGLSAK